MIVTSAYELQIGKIYTDKDLDRFGLGKSIFYYDKQQYLDFTFYVIREATREEFDKDILEKYGESAEIHYANYYEISMD